jgi:hypothetical protein
VELGRLTGKGGSDEVKDFGDEVVYATRLATDTASHDLPALMKSPPECVARSPKILWAKILIACIMPRRLLLLPML